jgi:hypothetical protein
VTLAKILEVADAVLYEGYLLYPYRSTSSKNQSRWQFGVLGPPGAARDGLGEEAEMHCECLIRPDGDAALGLHLRFLQLQSRSLERVDLDSPGGFVPADELVAGVRTFTTWDEATEKTVEVGPIALAHLGEQIGVPISVDGGDEIEVVQFEGATIGRVIRRRWPLRAEVRLEATTAAPGVLRLSVNVRNTATPTAATRHEATRASLLGAHVILEAADASFVSLLEPPDDLLVAAQECENRRCWPVLAGEEGSDDALLISPIILYDYPAIAPESAGSLFDSTEIDEILTLRVMTLTDEEKAEARATDAAAALIIDRCDAMTPEDLQQLHGVLRDPLRMARGVEGADDLLSFRTSLEPTASDPLLAQAPWAVDDDVPSFVTPSDLDEGSLGAGKAPWWDPGVDGAVSPSTDEVVVNGVAISKGSAVRLHPTRSADAQDLFFVDEPATVTAVFNDVDGQCHVAVVLDNDPAADLHEWYGRYLYFSPEEVEPLGARRPETSSRDDVADNNDKEE